MKILNIIKRIKSIPENQLEYVQKSIKSIDEKKKVFLSENKHKIFSISKKIISLPTKSLQYAQDKLEQSINNEKEEVLLKQSPYWARAITWTLMGGSALGLLWLSIAKTEEIAIVTGRLEPVNKVIEVQMPIGGVIEKINVKEGEMVSKGQILLTLDQEITQARISNIKNNLEIQEDILGRLKILQEAGAISEVQYLDQLSKVSTIKTDLNENKVTLKYQTINSPIEGKVFDMKPKSKGFVAQSSEPILKIVPTEDLKAIVEIDTAKIGFISVGKKADISIDSFPATDFGVIEGKVTSIGSDALPPDAQLGKGYRFPATITLNSQYLKLKNGKKLPIQVGMSLNANVKLREVTYLQLLLGTFQNKADSLRSL